MSPWRKRADTDCWGYTGPLYRGSECLRPCIPSSRPGFGPGTDYCLSAAPYHRRHAVILSRGFGGGSLLNRLVNFTVSFSLGLPRPWHRFNWVPGTHGGFREKNRGAVDRRIFSCGRTAPRFWERQLSSSLPLPGLEVVTKLCSRYSEFKA